MSAITLCSTMPKYEKYREAWELLREATMCEEPASQPEEIAVGPGIARMQGAMNAFRRMLESGGR
jgi:hypothetical protein